MSEVERPASLSAIRQGSIVRATKSATKPSSFARVTLITKCLGPVASAVMYGRLISVAFDEESSIFAFSAASFKRCNASGSFFKFTLCSFLNSSTKNSINALSKSSPPRKVSPFVDNTSICWSPSRSAISMIDTSNVPPPKS